MASIPPLGIGTGTVREPGPAGECVEYALELGYRHVDTAQSYENESGVGAAIRRSSVPREEVFLATKVHQRRLAYEEVLESVEDSLDRLGVETIDLLYVHTPRTSSAYDPHSTLPAFDELHDRGVIEHVGLANFSIELLDEAREILDAPLFAHQAEMHPLLQQDELLEYAREHDHHFVAHTPVLRGDVREVPEIRRIAERHDATAPQVSLAWLMGRTGVIAVAGADARELIEEDYAALDLELTEADVEAIESIDRERRLCDWDDGPWNW